MLGIVGTIVDGVALIVGAYKRGGIFKTVVNLVLIAIIMVALLNWGKAIGANIRHNIEQEIKQQQKSPVIEYQYL